MSKDEIISRVNDLMREGFEVPAEKLKPEALLFQDLGLDSLDAIDMLVHLEEKFGVKVSGEKLIHIKVLSDVYDLVENVARSVQDQHQVSH